MLPTEGLTPCITKGGKSRSRGRRVTICPEENSEHKLMDSSNTGQHDDGHSVSYKSRKSSIGRSP